MRPANPKNELLWSADHFEFETPDLKHIPLNIPTVLKTINIGLTRHLDLYYLVEINRLIIALLACLKTSTSTEKDSST
jgi:hypothetical protein